MSKYWLDLRNPEKSPYCRGMRDMGASGVGLIICGVVGFICWAIAQGL